MKLKIKEKTTLTKLPNGSLFLSEDKTTLALKSEYHTEGGAVEAYIVGSGEMFWGGTNDPKVQRNLPVHRIKLK